MLQESVSESDDILETAGIEARSQVASSMPDVLQQLGDAALLDAFPWLSKPHKWLKTAREAGLVEDLLKQVLLAEEMRRSCQPDESLEAWRLRRWDKLVEQAFIAQRNRFEKATYYHLNLPEQGLAMELYYQLCNGEVSFDQLLAQYLPVKPGKPQKGILRQRPLHKLPKSLAKRLRRSCPGIPLEPMVIGKAVTLFQMIEWHPPTLDDDTRELLLGEVEAQWLQKELHRRLESAVEAVRSEEVA
jgi:hypothetical protein